MEERDVIDNRLRWRAKETQSGYSLSYEMILVQRGDEFVAIRDHSVTIPVSKNADESRSNVGAVVHLSHSLIAPSMRGKGIAGWLRAWPIQMARNSLIQAGRPGSSITLAAEMEPLIADSQSHIRRLRSYGKGGFLMVDPKKAPYLQPDFRSPKAIDASGGAKPLRLQLVIRRVGLENQREMPVSELIGTISCLYQMYGALFRRQDMASVWKSVDSEYPPLDERVALINPTSIV